jgi:hypothetical protein
MTGKQKIRNALFDHVFVTTVSTYQFAFSDLCLQEKSMEVLQKLIIFKRLALGFHLWDVGKVELIERSNQMGAERLKKLSIGTYLICHLMKPLPIDSGNDISYELWLEINVL